MPISSSTSPTIRSDAELLPPTTHFLHIDSVAMPSIIAPFANAQRQDASSIVTDHYGFIPVISNRVTTLSTMESVESSSARRAHDLMPELNITDVKGSEYTTGALGHRDTDPEEMIQENYCEG